MQNESEKSIREFSVSEIKYMELYDNAMKENKYLTAELSNSRELVKTLTHRLADVEANLESWRDLYYQLDSEIKEQKKCAKEHGTLAECYRTDLEHERDLNLLKNERIKTLTKTIELYELRNKRKQNEKRISNEK